jgi:hypothetical protein
MLEKITTIVKTAGRIMLDAHHIRDGVESKEGRANFVTKYDVEVRTSYIKNYQESFPMLLL